MHYHTDMITHRQPLVNQSSALVEQVDTNLIEFHLPEIYRARTWTPCLTDEDANHYAIFPPLVDHVQLCEDQNVQA